jgi:hypothetical protein
MIGIGIANSLGVNLSGINPATKSFMSATGISNPNEVKAINDLVTGLQADGLWPKMKAVYPFVTDNKNFIGYTEDFSNAYWFKNAVTITTDSVTAPNGKLTADSLVENTANTDHYISTSPSLTLTVAPYTFSMYFKKASRDWANLSLYDGTDSRVAWFNVNTGTLGTVQSGVTASIENVGNGWYRCSITRTMSAGINYAGIGASIIDGGGAYLGNGSTALYIWGAQIELGSTATTYQPIATTQQAYIANQFKYNLVNPVDSDAAFRLVFNGGWTHSSNGATPNGTNAYADSKLVPSSVLALNSTHISTYLRTNVSGLTCDISVIQDSVLPNDQLNIYPRYIDEAYFRVYDGSTATVANTNSQGLFIANRVNSTQTRNFKNSTLTIKTVASGVISTSRIILGAGGKPDGTPAAYSTRQQAFSTIGDGLTDTEAANLYTRVQTFNQALGRQVGVPIVSDSDAQAFLNSAEITNVTEANAINTLVTDLKAQGLWTKMKAVYPFVGGTASTHKWNLKDPRDLDAAYRLVFNGGWTHSSNGATPNGTNGYADTKLVPSTSLSTSSAHFAKYNRNNDLTGGKIDGSFSTGTTSFFQQNYSNGNGIIGDITSIASYTPTDTRGLFTATRTATNSIKVFRNTTNISTNTITISAIPSSQVFIGARNDGGGGVFYNTYQAAFASIGDGLNDTEAAALYNSVNNFQVALSRNV